MLHLRIPSAPALIITLAALLLTPGGARAPVTTALMIHVDCTNDTGIEDGSELHPYNTIQEGIDAAVDGDTVLVHPCAYYENIDFLGKAITVTSTDPLDPAVVHTTAIDGGGAGSVVTFAGGEGPDSVLQGLTVRNGSGTVSGSHDYHYGGGVYCSRSAPTIAHNVITANTVDHAGAGIYCYGASIEATIADNTISDNTAWFRGGGIYCEASSPAILNNAITGNTSTHYHENGGGGGICCSASSPAISGNIITDNSTGAILSGAYLRYGGGICCRDESSPVISDNNFARNTGAVYCVRSSPIISYNAVFDNMPGWGGGGIACRESSATVSDNTITGNYGRGVAVIMSAGIIRNNVISDNVSVSDGGGIQCWGSWTSSASISHNTITCNRAHQGGGINCSWHASPRITNNAITGNSGSYGGGIGCSDAAVPIISGNVITDNRAHDGGGIHSDGSAATISGNVVGDNHATYCGGGVSCYKMYSGTIVNNTIFGNSAGSGGGIYCEAGPAPTIRGNVISRNFATGSGGGICCESSSAALASNLITTNTAERNGGGVYCRCYGQPPAITNCTIADDSAANGEGTYVAGCCAPMLCNSIVWGSTCPDCELMVVEADASISVSWSNVRTATGQPWPGEGNICADPQFVDPENGDYHLLRTSPCIDMGTNECVAPDDLDIDGQPRIWPPGGLVDMGADEVVCYCDVAIDRTHCKMPAAGHIGQCKMGQIGARNMSFTEPCDVVMRVTDNAGIAVFESQPTTIAPGQRLRLRFEHCYTADEIGRNMWTWEVWAIECSEQTPWDNVQYRRVNVQPGTRSSPPDIWLPLWRGSPR